MNQAFLYNLAIVFTVISVLRVILFLWRAWGYVSIPHNTHLLLAAGGKRITPPRMSVLWPLILIVAVCYLFSV